MSMNLHTEIRLERERRQCSVFEARHIVHQRRALEAVDAATSLEDLKPVLRELILNTRYTHGTSG